MTVRPICMIVENEALIAMALDDELVDAGFEISGPFHSGAAALLAVERAPPDIAVLDSVLNDGPCFELARVLKCAGIPFVIHSASDRTDLSAPELADALWIAKPSPLCGVANGIRYLLDRHFDNR